MLLLQSLRQILDEFDVAVLDQWGVMHDGSEPYADAVQTMRMLAQEQKPIIVVSNSGKRSTLNRDRISRIGLPCDAMTHVVTSGETLWEDVSSGELKIDAIAINTLFPICARFTDAVEWSAGHQNIRITDTLSKSTDAIMLMGLPDGASLADYQPILQKAFELRKPLLCSNPDKTSPRSDGLVTSPGALADLYESMGGHTVWYGKPYANIYRNVMRQFPHLSSDRFLMVGDSLEHDVAGAQKLGMKTAFIRGGIHANDFATADNNEKVKSVCHTLTREAHVALPDYCLSLLS